MEYQSLGQILHSILRFTGVLFAISQKFSVVGFASIYFWASVIVLGYSFIICVREFVLPKIEIDWDFWKLTIKTALPFSLTIIIAGMFFNIDIIMLSTMKGNEFAGWYKAAINLLLFINTIAVSFVYAIVPIMSKLFISDKKILKTAIEKSSKYLFILALPISAGIFLLAGRIILFIYGTEFIHATIALRILCLYLPLRVISHVTGWTFFTDN